MDSYSEVMYLSFFPSTQPSGLDIFQRFVLHVQNSSPFFLHKPSAQNNKPLTNNPSRRVALLNQAFVDISNIRYALRNYIKICCGEKKVEM